MLEKETIELNDINTDFEEEKLVVKVKVRNPTDRTLYAYGSVRQILYDNATGKLTLRLHDNFQDEDNLNSLHLPQPRIVQLEGKTTAEIKLKIAPTIKRMRSAAERAGGPIVEELRISEAEEIEIEIGHQDTPFYYNPKINNVKQFKEWGRMVSKGNFKTAPIKQKEKPEIKKKSRK